jgi:transcriptional regulator with XRE-family HTH domain
MTLDVWMTAQNVTNTEFAVLIGVTRQALSRYRLGERMPDAEMVEKIEKATGGAVTVADLHAARLGYLRGQGHDEMDAAS